MSQDEWLGPWEQPYFNFSKTRFYSALVSKQHHDDTLSEYERHNFMVTWFDLIAEYRDRALTKSTDRVVAFAGIARALHNITQFTYLAGIWKEQFLPSLLWHLAKTDAILGHVKTSTTDEPLHPNFPTWSWFSMPVRDDFRLSFYYDHLYAGHHEVIYKTSISSFNSPLWSADENHSDSFHAFQRLSITINMLVYETALVWHDKDVVAGDLIQQLNTEACASQYDFHFDFYSDSIAHTAPLPGSAFLGLLTETDRPERIGRELQGLALAPASKRGTYRRIGMWNLRITYHEIEVAHESHRRIPLFSTWEGTSEFDVVLV